VSRKWFPGIKQSRPAAVGLDTGVPHPARIYDYILGGKDNFAADQAAAQAAMAASPYLVTAMRENRAVMRRAAAFLVGDRDIRQFLDIGTGLQLVPPGIVPMAEWRADGEPRPRPSPLEAGGYVAVARKD
jgi:hypothetical protein